MMHEEKIIKNFPFRLKEEKEELCKENIKKNFVFSYVYNSPNLTINVPQKERIKILKQKKCCECTPKALNCN
jgi:hypothetical protein